MAEMYIVLYIKPFWKEGKSNKTQKEVKPTKARGWTDHKHSPGPDEEKKLPHPTVAETLGPVSSIS